MAACGATGAPTDATAVTCLLAAGATGETPTDADVLTCLAAAVDATEQTACVTAGAEICIGVCAEAAVVAYVMANTPAILADDSDHDLDATGTGRLTMNFDIPCVPIIEAREVVAEFIEVGENGGCMVESACNYDSTATIDDWTCIYGSNDSAGLEPCYETAGCAYGCCGSGTDTDGDGICDDMEVLGCQDSTACNYDATATDSGDCTHPETYYNCDGTCITDTDGDGVCDELSINDKLIPVDYNVNTIYPNPFNPITTISFSIPQSGMVSLKVYDITGRVTTTLKDEYMSVGYYNINWNASSHPSGVYLLQMISGSFSKTQKIVLMK